MLAVWHECKYGDEHLRQCVVRRRKIPFEIAAKPSEDNVLNDFYAFRREVAASDRPELTMEEINEEIRLAREEKA